MLPNPFVTESISISQAAGLGAISCGENDGEPLFGQFIDDGLEEWDMRRIF